MIENEEQNESITRMDMRQTQLVNLRVVRRTEDSVTRRYKR